MLCQRQKRCVEQQRTATLQCQMTLKDGWMQCSFVLHELTRAVWGLPWNCWLCTVTCRVCCANKKSCPWHLQYIVNVVSAVLTATDGLNVEQYCAAGQGQMKGDLIRVVVCICYCTYESLLWFLTHALAFSALLPAREDVSNRLSLVLCNLCL